MNVRCVLLLDCRPESVTYRRYFESAGGATALECCVDEFSLSCGSPVEVVAFSCSDFEKARRILTNAPHTVVNQSGQTPFGAIARLTVGEESDNILVFRLECLLAPPGLGRELLAKHAQLGTDITVMEGLPPLVAPIAFRRDSIPRIQLLGLPTIDSDCWTAIDVVRMAGIEQVTEALNLTLGFCQLVDVYGQPSLLPYNVSVEYADDVHRVLEIVDRYPSGQPAGVSACARIREWQVVTAAARQGYRRDLLRPLTARHSRARTYDDRLRVLYVSNASGYSGAEESLAQMLRFLPANCDKYAVVALDGMLTTQLRGAGVNVVCVGREFASPSIDNLLVCMRLLQEIEPDIVHLNGLDGLPILAAAQLRSVPIVVHARNGVFPPYEEYARSADRIIAVSEFVNRGLQPFVHNADQIVVIRDEVDADYFSPNAFSQAEARETLGVPAARLVVACIARFAPNKRHDVLLSAIADAARNVPSLHLILKGEVFEDPATFRAVQDLMAKLALQDRVTWIPFIADIRYVHAAADMLVLCSENEGLGRCVVEAMAMQLPVVVSDSGGAAEIVADGISGRVLPVGDARGLSVVICELALDRELRGRYGRAGRLFVQEHLTAEASARAVWDIYSRLRGRGEAGGARD